MDNEGISDFYDSFSQNQQATGVHLRHYTILQKLRKAGLKRDAIVLEIGCGIGTLTGLLASYLSKGKIIATDISSESIRIAKHRTSKHTNISYHITDMSEFTHLDKFDFVVFPDVLEHIPKENHNNIFKNISKSIHADSKIAIHIPDPINLDFIRKNTPELLQIIDQSLYIEDFALALSNTPFMVDEYLRYSLFTVQPDYNWILLSVKGYYKTVKKQSKLWLKLVELYRRYYNQ